MIDILNDYLNGAASAEIKELIEDAHNTFDRIGLPNYEDGFVEILMLEDTVDIQDTLFNIINLTKTLQKQILKEHEIELVDEASITIYTLFINGLLDIQEYADKATMYKAISIDGNSKELLAEALSLVTHKNADELLSEIESVGDSLIGLIKDNLEEPDDINNSNDYLLKQDYITNFRVFCIYINRDDLDIIRLISDGLDVGFPFTVYANMISDTLESKNIDIVAAELVGIAIISSDGHENPISIIKSHIEQYISDIDRITRILISVNELLLGLSRI